MRKNALLSLIIICILCFSIFSALIPQALASHESGFDNKQTHHWNNEPSHSSHGKKAQAHPGIAIEVYVKDSSGSWVEADTASGPTLTSGPVAFKVQVTNTGNVELSKVTVKDSLHHTLVSLKKMPSGQSWTHTYRMDFTSGQQMYSAYVKASYQSKTYTDSDRAYYFGSQQNPSIRVVETANTDTATVGDAITYSFSVTNPGDTPLTSVSVKSAVAGTASLKEGDVNSNGILETSETWFSRQPTLLKKPVN